MLNYKIILHKFLEEVGNLDVLIAYDENREIVNAKELMVEFNSISMNWIDNNYPNLSSSKKSKLFKKILKSIIK